MRHLVIIGGGPAGTAAAQAARARNLDVTLIECDLTGGTCLNRGCIPTKLLLGGSVAVPELRAVQNLRLGAGSVELDFGALMARKDRFIKGTRQALEKQLASLGIALIHGTVTTVSQGSVRVTDASGQTKDLMADAVILATGSRPAAFPGLEPDGQAVLDSSGILGLTEPPRSLLIIGAGAIGLEMGDFFHRMGAAITLVEAKDRLVPTEDPEVSQVLSKYYAKEGWTLRLGRRVESLVTEGNKARLTLDGDEVLEADKALVAVGRFPNSRGLGLEALDAQLTSPGWVRTDGWLRAIMRGTWPVYAVGDVNGRTLLAHAAEHQARYAVAHLCGETEAPYAPPVMPACIYGHMEVMRAGPIAEELLTGGKAGQLEVSRSQLIANPIAQAHGTTAGFVKICWRDGMVHGVTAVGYGVTGLITTSIIMTSQHWTRDDARRVIFAHPTLDEALAQALCAPREAC